MNTLVQLLLVGCTPLDAWTATSGIFTTPAHPLANTHTHTTHSAIAMLKSVRSTVVQALSRSEDEKVRHFRGGMYGVVATVALDMHSRKAVVELRGAPIGGRVSGVGWLADHRAEEGSVVLDSAFSRRLSRRFVSIQSAALNRQFDTVTVSVTVPVFGTKALTLHRIPAPLSAMLKEL